jgi:bacteriorhodopsin
VAVQLSVINTSLYKLAYYGIRNVFVVQALKADVIKTFHEVHQNMTRSCLFTYLLFV